MVRDNRAKRWRDGAVGRTACLVLVYQCTVYGLGVLILVGLCPQWGHWYLDNSYHRRQVDALLGGSFSLSRAPSMLAHDLCWSRGGVHQVWGLGMAMWQLPFDVVARAVGGERFPDVFTLAIALGLGAWTLLWALYQCKSEFSESEARTWSTQLILTVGAATLFLLFPPFINLLHSRFAVYEEVVAYEDPFGLVIISRLVTIVQYPSRRSFLLLCLVAGLGALLRPTLILHGMAAVAAGVLPLWWKTAGGCTTRVAVLGGSHTGDESAHLRKRGLGEFLWTRTVAAGIGLFVLGGALLFVTNLLRFGNGFEFGHRLNVQYLYGSLYATRFDAPYENEPFVLRGSRNVRRAVFDQRFQWGRLLPEEHFFGAVSNGALA